MNKIIYQTEFDDAKYRIIQVGVDDCTVEYATEDDDWTDADDSNSMIIYMMALLEERKKNEKENLVTG